MGLIQDVNSRVWVEWRRESVVIGTADDDSGANSESCELGYEDLQALISVLGSSTGDRDSRFLEWGRKKKQ